MISTFVNYQFIIDVIDDAAQGCFWICLTYRNALSSFQKFLYRRIHGSGYESDNEHPHESAHLHSVARRRVFDIGGCGASWKWNNVHTESQDLSSRVFSCNFIKCHRMYRNEIIVLSYKNANARTSHCMQKGGLRAGI